MQMSEHEIIEGLFPEHIHTLLIRDVVNYEIKKVDRDDVLKICWHQSD